ncbi:MAG TPA: prolipoprotein diacylglyceryl transferase [Candidatus Hydrogenedentes bacterium]|nr:prolipoprotein diacylglyceryl transferase [Candidatus Hydrogenedentota bacterium]
MHPVLLDLGRVKLHTYGLMIAIGFLVALFFIRRDARRRLGIEPDVVNAIGFWILITGVLGARLLHILLYPHDYSLTDPVGWVALWRGGLVFQGALPAALAYYYVAMRRKNLSFWAGLDVALPYLPLAHAFGRVGCFMYGCCYGRPTDLPWGIRFPEGSPAWNEGLHAMDAACTHALHPTQLYSVFGLLAICGLLLLARRAWRRFDGIAAPAYLFLYGVGRFIVEFFRGDNNPRHIGGLVLSDQQVIALGMALFGAALFVVLWRYAPSSVLEADAARKDAKS